MEAIPPIIHESWHPHLQPLFDDPKMKMLKYDILTKEKYYPNKSDIFKVFRMPLGQIKVVILGQDPYPNGEAVGLAFAVNEMKKMPPSLEIVRKEIYVEGTQKQLATHPEVDVNFQKWRTLDHWEKQGVFLLNTALTVKKGEAGSHTGYWEWFTRGVVEIIGKEQSCVWLLWGAKAQGFKDFIQPRLEGIVNIEVAMKEAPLELSAHNVILKAPHPAAEMYSSTNAKFTGCDHFLICNKILEAKDKSIINW